MGRFGAGRTDFASWERMNRKLAIAFTLAAAALVSDVASAGAQETRVHILRSRPYTSADSTGLLHAPARLVEVRRLSVPRQPGSCASHLRDPAINADLLLIASFSSSTVTTSGDTVFTYRSTYGDYAPKAGRVYGLSAGDYVRVDCSRDRPVARIRRSDSQSR